MQLVKDGWMDRWKEGKKKEAQEAFREKCAYDLAYGEGNFERRVVTAVNSSQREEMPCCFTSAKSWACK